MTREEAIDKVRMMKLSPGKDAELIIALHTLIPELRESEDERIRKDIINLIYWLKGNPSLCSQYYNDRYDDMLAYLEKQKEQKHYWKPTETDVALFNKAVTTNKALTPADRAQLDIIRSKFGCCRAVNCSGIVQKEQKPEERFEEARKKYQVEWSEEDEKNFEWFDKFFRAESILIDGKDIPQDKYLWFKSLRPQPKQDKSPIAKFVQAVEDAEQHRKGYEEGLRDGIKRHWKPSNEQMDALYGSIEWEEEMAEDVDFILKSLYNDLKKLM